MPPALLYFANLLWLLIILTALYRARRQLPRLQPVAIHLFCGAIPVLTLLALLKTAAAPGLELHLIGLTAATLLMGARLAILAAAFSQLLLLTLGELPPVALGLNGLTHAAIPVAISASFAALLRRYLPPNPFIYTLGAGFFGGILALSAAMLTTALIQHAGGAYPWDTLWDKYLQTLPIIAYPEGFINGVFATAMVAFHPNLLATFNPDDYLKETP
jgi:integral membrane protein